MTRVYIQYSNVELLYDDITVMCTNICKLCAPESDLYKVCVSDLYKVCVSDLYKVFVGYTHVQLHVCICDYMYIVL